jgi:hypothetical protein
VEATCEDRLDAVAVPVDCDLAAPHPRPVASRFPKTRPPRAAVPPIPGEVWRAIEAHSGYLVSSFGRVAHGKRGLARPWQKPDQAVLYVSIGGHNVVVHKLVAGAFLDEKPSDHRLGWRDGDRANCVVWNLEWVPLKAAPREPRDATRAPLGSPLPTLLATTFQRGFPTRLDRCPRCGLPVEQEPGFMRCRLGCGRLWPLAGVPVLVQRFYEYLAGLRTQHDFAAQMSGR